MCHDLHDKNSWKLVQQWHNCREVIPVFLHRPLNFNRYFNNYKNLLGVVQMLHSLHETTTTIKKEKLAVTKFITAKTAYTYYSVYTARFYFGPEKCLEDLQRQISDKVYTFKSKIAFDRFCRIIDLNSSRTTKQEKVSPLLADTGHFLMIR